MCCSLAKHGQDFSSLPHSILGLVWEALDDPLDRLAFRGTCCATKQVSDGLIHALSLHGMDYSDDNIIQAFRALSP